MQFTLVTYPLSDGFIHHWLVAGPISLPGGSAEAAASKDLLPFLSPDPAITGPLVELAPLEGIDINGARPEWQFYHCREDHYVDFTPRSPQNGLQALYCAVLLRCPAAQEVTLSLAGSGQVDVWLERHPAGRLGSLSQDAPQRTEIAAALKAGEHELLIRQLAPTGKGALSQVALRVSGPAAGEIEVVIPTQMDAQYLKLRERLEDVAGAAYLDRYVYGYLDGDHYNRNEPIPLRFSKDLQSVGELTFRLQSLGGDIFQEGTKIIGAGAEIEMARAFPLRSGAHHLALMPNAELYFVKKMRFERKELFFVARSPYSVKASPSYKERIRSALKDASERRGDSLYSEIAKMAIKSWEHLDRKIIQEALARVEQRAEGFAADLLGLLGALARFGKKRGFPKELAPAILDSAYAASYKAVQAESEGDEILLFAGEILAGQLLPETTFKESGQAGRWHQEQGEQKAIAWMRTRGMFGFRAWDSPEVVEAAVAALTHLVDLANSDAVCELASVLLDKLFFGLAVNSFNGAYASSRGKSDTAAVLSARLEATSGLARLVWGQGTFNDAVMGTVSLACCRNYALPAVIAAIAADRPAAVWSREQHSAPETSGRDGPSRQANKVTYRTADYMLSSVQDYDPGQPGQGEHVWQAALGPDALVFSNHPACMSEADSHHNNLWRGNGVLPRVAQWGDVLAALYRLPEDDWLGFTHAYFPAAAFDETHFEGGWAFARKGSGYLAITAARGFEFKTGGQTAYRELRSPGTTNAWLCHMGQELLDGSFTAFQQKIMAMEMKLGEQSIELKNLRGDAIAFGWQGALSVNGTDQPLQGFPHIETPYCSAALPAAQIEILHAQSGVRLRFD